MNNQNVLQTEFDFILPKGLIDASGKVHRQGVMRLTTARDEICVQKDHRVQKEPVYGVLVTLSLVITRLGELSSVTPELLENLFSRDLAYLREFYNRINQQGNADIPVQCPRCNNNFSVELSLAGE
ncbi:phage tail assembly protein [Nostoc sp. CENA67]|uniref:Phage tail assembly protein n=1 Tax=Amazonocrinis nigriterrae CENA67 TaxID=2794033 RepID=A0A8J7L9U1_9NOST|nr:phage tail assembly protein [Amazonocrinis nigriterrae]MBH8565984.1 phage tail assembly protein [Amazonocrinis nigriterrae CENA67]